MVHEHVIREFTKDFHSVREQVLHRVEVYEVVPHYLDERKRRSKLQPSEIGEEDDCEDEANASQEMHQGINKSDPLRPMIKSCVAFLHAAENITPLSVKFFVFP